MRVGSVAGVGSLVGAVIVVGVMLGCTGAVPRHSTSGHLSVEHDDFIRSSVAKWREANVFLSGRGRTELGALSIVGSNQATLRFSRSGQGWVYMSCHMWDALADGEPVALTNNDVATSVGSGGWVTEIVTVDVSLADLARLASAGSSRMRVCSDEFRLSNDQKATIRRFIHAARGSR